MRDQRRFLRSAALFFLMLALIGCSPPAAPSGSFAAQPPTNGSEVVTPIPTLAGGEAATPAPTTVPIDPDELAARARRAYRNGDLAAALRDYRQAMASGGVSSETLFGLGQVELAGGDAAAARGIWQRLLASSPEEPLRGRTQLLLATADLALGDGEAVLSGIDVAMAPEGLADLVVLRRAEAAAGIGNPEGAAGELRRPELRGSTNRLILEQAGRLAERVGDPALAAEFYLRATRYPAWTAERSRLIQEAATAFQQAGDRDRAIEQYQRLVELYGWTRAAEQAGAELEELGGLTPYHRGVLALIAGDRGAARAAFSEAADGGEYAAAASRQLRQMEESEAWLEAVDDDTAEAYRFFWSHYPEAAKAAEARFREGFAHYQAGQVSRALAIWDGVAAGASGDERTRSLLWAGKALGWLGRGEESRERLRAAAEVRPAGYYALRARDLLAGMEGWPEGGAAWVGGKAEELGEAERWLAGWAGSAATADVTTEPRVRRGLGLLALGLPAEAAAELNGLIAESQDGWFLFRLAGVLVEQQLWSSASRAATRLVTLSPAKTVTEAPPAVQRMVYLPAYWDLIGPEAERRDLDPLLLLALAYQESLFDPLALSPADARGLTQVIPPTGRGIASALGRSGFAPEDLYRPAVAVEFGGYYLADQLARFGGDPFRALAAYNAGAGPIPRWSAADPDLFVERIDYSETRSYVRQVYLHHALYRALQR